MEQENILGARSMADTGFDPVQVVFKERPDMSLLQIVREKGCRILEHINQNRDWLNCYGLRITREGVKSALSFAESGCVQIHTKEEFIEILSAASYLGLKAMAEALEGHLAAQTKATNIEAITSAFDILCQIRISRGGQEEAVQLVKDRIGGLLSPHPFNSLSLPAVLSLLSSPLLRSHLTELSVLKKALSWIDANPNNVASSSVLLDQIRFDRMSPKELQDSLEIRSNTYIRPLIERRVYDAGWIYYRNMTLQNHPANVMYGSGERREPNTGTQSTTQSTDSGTLRESGSRHDEGRPGLGGIPSVAFGHLNPSPNKDNTADQSSGNTHDSSLAGTSSTDIPTDSGLGQRDAPASYMSQYARGFHAFSARSQDAQGISSSYYPSVKFLPSYYATVWIPPIPSFIPSVRLIDSAPRGDLPVLGASQFGDEDDENRQEDGQTRGAKIPSVAFGHLNPTTNKETPEDQSNDEVHDSSPPGTSSTDVQTDDGIAHSDTGVSAQPICGNMYQASAQSENFEGTAERKNRSLGFLPSYYPTVWVPPTPSLAPSNRLIDHEPAENIPAPGASFREASTLKSVSSIPRDEESQLTSRPAPFVESVRLIDVPNRGRPAAGGSHEEASTLATCPSIPMDDGDFTFAAKSERMKTQMSGSSFRNFSEGEMAEVLEDDEVTPVKAGPSSSGYIWDGLRPGASSSDEAPCHGRLFGTTSGFSYTF